MQPQYDKMKSDPFFEEDFYTDNEIEILLEDDEISALEEGFMRGYIDEEEE